MRRAHTMRIEGPIRVRGGDTVDVSAHIFCTTSQITERDGFACGTQLYCTAEYTASVQPGVQRNEAHAISNVYVCVMV
jgi:hypothetical protein